MYLSIVIPAYNEAKRIGETLKDASEWLEKQPYEYEIIVVDNGSQDGTGKVVHDATTKIPHLQVIAEEKRGKGYAVRTGMRVAKGDIQLFMDADNSTRIEQYERMSGHFASFDILIGSIGVPGSTIAKGMAEPLWRTIVGKMGNLWIQCFAVPGIRDTQRGFKAFKANAADDIFKRMTVFGWGFDVEILAIARARGYAIKEIPIAWSHDPDSRVSWRAYPATLLDTLKVCWNRIRHRYDQGETRSAEKNT